MAKIVLVIEDQEDGTMDIKFTSNRQLPDVYEEWSMAEQFVAKLHDTINFILKEQQSG